jgi:hypothetical protein
MEEIKKVDRRAVLSVYETETNLNRSTTYAMVVKKEVRNVRLGEADLRDYPLVDAV